MAAKLVEKLANRGLYSLEVNHSVRDVFSSATIKH